MIGRVLLAALLAGIAAGLFLGLLTETRLVPLILQAETFETAAAGHDHAAATSAHEHSHDAGSATAPEASEHVHDSSAWAPQDGSERTFYTLITSMLAGAGFGAILAGLAFLLAIPITRANGIIWGLFGFLAVSVAPAAGLPPELPGMAAAPLVERQIWWLATIICTGLALWLVTQKKQVWAIPAALVAALAPHAFGAPIANEHGAAPEAWMVQHFVASSLAVNGLFWILLGVFLGFALERFEGDARE